MQEGVGWGVAFGDDVLTLPSTLHFLTALIPNLILYHGTYGDKFDESVIGQHCYLQADSCFPSPLFFLPGLRVTEVTAVCCPQATQPFLSLHSYPPKESQTGVEIPG